MGIGWFIVICVLAGTAWASQRYFDAKRTELKEALDERLNHIVTQLDDMKRELEEVKGKMK